MKDGKIYKNMLLGDVMKNNLSKLALAVTTPADAKLAVNNMKILI